jgi:hypothetical protein
VSFALLGCGTACFTQGIPHCLIHNNNWWHNLHYPKWHTLRGACCACLVRGRLVSLWSRNVWLSPTFGRSDQKTRKINNASIHTSNYDKTGNSAKLRLLFFLDRILMFAMWFTMAVQDQLTKGVAPGMLHRTPRESNQWIEMLTLYGSQQ